MTRRTKQTALASPVYRGRRLALLLFLLAGMVVPLFRAGYIEVFQQEWLQEQADKRQMRTMKVPPYRGMIVDRNDDPLAISSPVESIWCDPVKFFSARDALVKASKSEELEVATKAQQDLDELDVNLVRLEELLGMKSGELNQLL